jgi:hypothetical protein
MALETPNKAHKVRGTEAPTDRWGRENLHRVPKGAANTNPECETNVYPQVSDRGPKARKNNNNPQCETNVCPHLQAREKPILNGKQTYALRQQIENES